MADANKIYSVSELMKYMNVQMSKDIVLSEVRVKGEVTGFSAPTSGHIYFKLKEKGKDGWGRPKDYIINCAKFGHDKDKNCKVKMENGIVVTIIGRAAVYESRSEVQLIVSSIFDNNEIGSAKAEYEMRKKRLTAEGLFDEAHKKPIPPFPKSIGIVTSATGAVRYDIQAEVDKKNPYVQLYLYHSLVQGPGAAEQIVEGIKYFDEKTDVDIIIIGRGGGTEEDLGPFDDEMVVRAVYNAKKPIIAGTGHEVHFTLADYAADLRASTPTMAASDAVHDVITELRNLSRERQDLDKNFGFIITENEHKLDTIKEFMDRCMLDICSGYEKRLTDLRHELEKHSPEKILEARLTLLDSLQKDIHNAMVRKFDAYVSRLNTELGRLRSANPQAKLTGGFGYIEKDGTPVDSVKVVKKGDTIQITMHDGVITAKVE